MRQCLKNEIILSELSRTIHKSRFYKFYEKGGLIST